MPDIRAESVALLAEALHASCEAEWDIKASRGVTEMTLHFPDAHHDRAEAILAASPTLARRLDLATAWDEAVAALPEGWWLDILRRNGSYVADAWGVDGYARSGVHPTPTAALLALVAKLKEATR